MIGWILSGLTISGAILNSLKNKWGFIIWIVANFGWIMFNISTETYSQIPVWVILTIVSAFGFWEWHKKEKQHPLIKVEVLVGDIEVEE